MSHHQISFVPHKHGVIFTWINHKIILFTFYDLEIPWNYVILEDKFNKWREDIHTIVYMDARQAMQRRAALMGLEVFLHS